MFIRQIFTDMRITKPKICSALKAKINLTFIICINQQQRNVCLDNPDNYMKKRKLFMNLSKI